MTGRPYDDLTVQKETLVTVNNSTRPDENIPPTAKPRYNEPRYNEPRYNEPLYNEVLGITNDFLCPSQSKIYEKELRYNET